MRALKKERELLHYQNEAAIIIQRNLAKKYHGKLRLARMTLISVHSFRKLVDVVFTLMTEQFIDSLAKDLIDEHVDHWLQKFNPAMRRAEDIVLDIVIDRVMTLGVEEWMEEQVRMMEEQRRRVAEQRQELQETLRMAAEEEAARVYYLELQRIAEERRKVIERQRKLAFDAVVQHTVSATIKAGVKRRVDALIVIFVAQQRKAAFTQFVMNFSRDTINKGLRNIMKMILQKHAGRRLTQEISEKTVDGMIDQEIHEIIREEYAAHLAEQQRIEYEQELKLQQERDAQERAERAAKDALIEAAQLAHDNDNDHDNDDESESEVSSSSAYDKSDKRNNVSNQVRNFVELFGKAEYKELLEHLDQHIKKLRKSLKEHQNDEASSHIKTTIMLSISVLLQARTLMALGRYEESRESFDQAKKSREETLGANHYLVAEVYTHYADWYRAHGFYSEAENLLKKVSLRELFSRAVPLKSVF